MASIDAMSIRGIRSFGPDEAETIKFAKPLTVIVGENGCGKTTIIECLKYATTGCLPPGAQSGQSFVHDPKIAGRTEVKGQIKLKFKNRVPQTMVCVRDLQVTQTRTKITFKALEGVLVMYQFAEDGTRTDKVSITHACTKMDSIMPELLGVPKSVLEHVVLCHQEESNWPLAEGAKLKERFDQIFESDRYTKALNDTKNMKDVSKYILKANLYKIPRLVICPCALTQLEQLTAKLNIKINQEEVEKSIAGSAVNFLNSIYFTMSRWFRGYPHHPFAALNLNCPNNKVVTPTMVIICQEGLIVAIDSPTIPEIPESYFVQRVIEETKAEYFEIDETNT